jgi:AcrR family transcriptional regulator
VPSVAEEPERARNATGNAARNATTKGEHTRNALLAAAIQCFAVSGVKGVTLTDVARMVGISPAAVYAYFPGKDALFTAAVDADAAGLIQRAMTAMVDGILVADWSPLIGALLEGLPHHPLARRVLAGLEPDQTERLVGIPALVKLRKGIAHLVSAGQATGEYRPDIDAGLVADGLGTIIVSLLMAILQSGGVPDERRVAGVIAVLDAALRVPAPRRSTA